MNDDKKTGATAGGTNNPQNDPAAPMLRIEDAIRTHTEKWEASESANKPYRHVSLILTGISVALAGVGSVIAGISVYLSANQTQVNRQSLVAVQRAFVFPNDLELNLVPITAQGRDIVTFHPIYENSGSTPTRNFYQYFKVEFVYREAIRAFSKAPPADVKYVFGVIAPHAKSPGGIDSVPLKDFLTIGHLDKPDLIAFGEVHYLDVFGGVHVTKFCYDFESGSLQLPPDTSAAKETSASQAPISVSAPHVQSLVQLCPVDNCADEECDVQR